MKRLVLFLMAVSITVMVYGQSIDEIIRLDEEATKLSNKSDFYSAAKKWEKGLIMAKRMGNKKWFFRH